MNNKLIIQYIIDQGAVINSESISRYEHSCSLLKAVNTTETEFSGEYSCSEDGSNSTEKITLKLDAGGKLLGLDNVALPSCK